MLTYFLSPQGRFRRRDAWFGFAVVTIILLTGLCCDILFGGVNLIAVEGPVGFTLAPAPTFLAVAGLLVLWPCIAMSMKRWHDRDRSGWWALLWFVPVLNLYALISMFLLPGMRGLNRFGPDPREEERYLSLHGHDGMNLA